MFRFLFHILLLVAFLGNVLGPIPVLEAQEYPLPAPGQMVHLSTAFEPVIIRGLSIHKDNPFLFDFIVDAGQEKRGIQDLKKEGERLIQYFLTGLAIPDKDLWVNLSPYEKDRIIPQVLSRTEMGKGLLAEDYILKQLTASLIYPESRLGKDFWDRVYEKARQAYGVSQIPINTFNKVWIIADKAEVYEHDQTALVVGLHLKVMLEEDYFALQKHILKNKTFGHGMTSQVVRNLILPELEKEVNAGKNFAQLRQIFNSIALSTWYKRRLDQAVLSQVYADKSKVNGIELKDRRVKEEIYERYLKAYKKGVFNYIKEDIQGDSRGVPRKYFSGGTVAALGSAFLVTQSSKAAAMMINARGAGEHYFLMPTAFNASSWTTKAMASGDEWGESFRNLPNEKRRRLRIYKDGTFLTAAKIFFCLTAVSILLYPLAKMLSAFKANEKESQLRQKIEENQFLVSPASLEGLPQGTNATNIERITGVDPKALATANPTVNLTNILSSDTVVLPGVSVLAFYSPISVNIVQLANDLEDPHLTDHLMKISANAASGRYSLVPANHILRGDNLVIAAPDPEIDKIQRLMGLHVTKVQGHEIPGGQLTVGANSAGPISFISALKGEQPRAAILFTPKGPLDNPYGYYVHQASKEYDDFRKKLSFGYRSEIVGKTVDGKWIYSDKADDGSGGHQQFFTIRLPQQANANNPSPIMYFQVDRMVEQLGMGLDHINPIQLWTYPNGVTQLVAKSLENAPLSMVYDIKAMGQDNFKSLLELQRHHETILGRTSSHGSIRLVHVFNRDGQETQYITVMADSKKGPAVNMVWEVVSSKVSSEIPDSLLHSFAEKTVNKAQASIVTPSYGGIDANMTSNLTKWRITKDGRGLEMTIDQALIARIKRQGIESLYPTIFKVIPVSVQYLEGLLNIPTLSPR